MLRILTILLFVVASISFIIFEASAKCVEDHCYGIPGMSPLKEQLEVHTIISNIRCQNQEHVLVERPNGKLACVKHGTAENLGWNNHYYSRADSKGNTIVTSGATHTIPYEIMGATLEDLSYADKVFTATIKTHSQYNVLSLVIKDTMLTNNPQQCSTIQNHTPNLAYIVSVNGEETKVGMHFNFSGEKTLDLHTTENAETIQVIGVCNRIGWG